MNGGEYTTFSSEEICLRRQLESGIPSHSLTIIREPGHSPSYYPSHRRPLLWWGCWLDGPNGVPSLGLSYRCAGCLQCLAGLIAISLPLGWPCGE